MADQAEKLRLLARNLKNQAEAEITGKPTKTRVITITSGKGGVGKTNFSINLSLALISYGHKVILLDADLGLANIDVVLGISPAYNLYHVIKGEKTINEVITEGPMGLKVIAGGSGIQELANLRKGLVESFIDSLEGLEGDADFLLIDTGAGLSRNVMRFVFAADEVLLVTTPEPTAITDAYGLVKTMLSKRKSGTVHLVVNQVASSQEADLTANKLLTVADRFLKYKIDKLGFILADPMVSKAVMSQEPFILKYPKSAASQCVFRLAARLTNQEKTAEASGVKGFFERMVRLFD